MLLKRLSMGLVLVATMAFTASAADIVIRVRPPRVVVQSRAQRPSRNHVWVPGTIGGMGTRTPGTKAGGNSLHRGVATGWPITTSAATAGMFWWKVTGGRSCRCFAFDCNHQRNAF